MDGRGEGGRALPEPAGSGESPAGRGADPAPPPGAPRPPRAPRRRQRHRLCRAGRYWRRTAPAKSRLAGAEGPAAGVPRGGDPPASKLCRLRCGTAREVKEGLRAASGSNPPRGFKSVQFLGATYPHAPHPVRPTLNPHARSNTSLPDLARAPTGMAS